MWDFQKCNQKATTQKQLNRIGCLWEKNVSHLLKSVSSDIFVVVKLLANIPAYSFIIKGHTSSSPIYSICVCPARPTSPPLLFIHPTFHPDRGPCQMLTNFSLSFLILSCYLSFDPPYLSLHTNRGPRLKMTKRFYLSSLLCHQYTNTGWTVLIWTCTTHAE